MEERLLYEAPVLFYAVHSSSDLGYIERPYSLLFGVFISFNTKAFLILWADFICGKIFWELECTIFVGSVFMSEFFELKAEISRDAECFKCLLSFCEDKLYLNKSRRKGGSRPALGLASLSTTEFYIWIIDCFGSSFLTGLALNV